MVLSQVPPLRTRLDRRLPALSSLRGHMQAHEMRCAAEGNRLMSIPISETMTWAPRFLKAPAERIEADVARMREIMRRASRIVFNATGDGQHELRTDATIVRYPEHYSDKRGAAMWDHVLEFLSDPSNRPSN